MDPAHGVALSPEDVERERVSDLDFAVTVGLLQVGFDFAEVAGGDHYGISARLESLDAFAEVRLRLTIRKAGDAGLQNRRSCFRFRVLAPKMVHDTVGFQEF